MTQISRPFQIVAGRVRPVRGRVAPRPARTHVHLHGRLRFERRRFERVHAPQSAPPVATKARKLSRLCAVRHASRAVKPTVRTRTQHRHRQALGLDGRRSRDGRAHDGRRQTHLRHEACSAHDGRAQHRRNPSLYDQASRCQDQGCDRRAEHAGHRRTPAPAGQDRPDPVLEPARRRRRGGAQRTPRRPARAWRQDRHPLRLRRPGRRVRHDHHAVQVTQTPTLLIVNPHGQTTVLTGLTDAFAIEQTVAEARDPDTSRSESPLRGAGREHVADLRAGPGVPAMRAYTHRLTVATGLAEHLERPLARGHIPADAHTGAAGGAACGDLIRVSLSLDPDGPEDRIATRASTPAAAARRSPPAAPWSACCGDSSAAARRPDRPRDDRRGAGWA